ncbi:MAG: hypothetical protein ACRDFB_00615 [Rhabdochlamydiaceae bacterium]
MNVKRILGIIVFIAGVVMLFVSSNIKKQVAEGTLKVRSAEKTVNQANSLFSLSPATKQLTQGTMKGAQKKIAAGKEQIAHYSKLADELQVGGFVLICAGILIFVLGAGHKGKK